MESLPNELDDQRLKWEAKNLFSLHSLSTKNDASAYLVQFVSHFKSDKERFESLRQIVDLMMNMNPTTAIVNLNMMKNVIESWIEKTSNENKTLLNVIDLHSIPRLEYDEKLRKLVVHKVISSSVGNSSDVISMYRNRLKLIQQRVLRSALFIDQKLTHIKSLIGVDNNDEKILLLGILNQLSEEEYMLEDFTGSIEVDLKDAKFYSGLFTDGGIVVLRGHMEPKKFVAEAVGLSPVESSTRTRAEFGDDNWFNDEEGLTVKMQGKLIGACRKNPDAKLVFVSDVWLDNELVISGLEKMFVGFLPTPPVAYVFCGDFCSSSIDAKKAGSIIDGFQSLADLISKLIERKEYSTKSSLIFIPGPNDPFLSGCLPKFPLPLHIRKIMEKVPNCIFAANPCRIQYANREIVIFRHDIVEKMCRNSIHMPDNTAIIPEHFCRTLASIGHLSPLPLNISPVLWKMDHCLSIYPLPDLVIIADKFPKFVIKQNDCLFANPSSFPRSEFDFFVYYPASSEIEPSRLY